MLNVLFKPKFIKILKNLPDDLQEEIFEKVNLFKNTNNHKQLKVHKLHGRLNKLWSFSVNYKIRIIFTYLSKKEAVLLTVGDHEIYK